MFAHKPQMAKEWAKETPNMGALPPGPNAKSVAAPSAPGALAQMMAKKPGLVGR